MGSGTAAAMALRAACSGSQIKESKQKKNQVFARTSRCYTTLSKKKIYRRMDRLHERRCRTHS